MHMEIYKRKKVHWDLMKTEVKCLGLYRSLSKCWFLLIGLLVWLWNKKFCLCMFLEPTGTKFVSNEGNSVSYSWKQPEPLTRLKLMTDYSQSDMLYLLRQCLFWNCIIFVKRSWRIRRRTVLLVEQFFYVHKFALISNPTVIKCTLLFLSQVSVSQSIANRV